MHAFRAWGHVGLGLGAAVGLATGLWRGVGVATIIAMATAGVLSFFAWAQARRWVTGRERLVVLEHVWIACAAAAGIVWLADEPVARSLDVFVVGLGVFLAAGRIGCATVGCCHGTPSSIGVRYGSGFGLPPRRAAQRLFPVQLVEAGGLVAITAVAIALAGNRPGTAFVWFAASYAMLRFATESLRGDDRPRLGRLDVTRAMCVVQGIGALVLAERWLVDGSPDRTSLVGAICAGTLALIALAVAVRRENPLTTATHLDDAWALVMTLGRIARADDPLVDETVEGMRVAVSRSGDDLHVSLSHDCLDVDDVARLLSPIDVEVRGGVVHLRMTPVGDRFSPTTAPPERNGFDPYFDPPRSGRSSEHVPLANGARAM